MPSFGAPPTPTFGDPPAVPPQQPVPPPPPPIVIDGVTAVFPSESELVERQAQAPMFAGAVLRDVYAFCCQPSAPHAAAEQTGAADERASRFGAALLGKRSGRDAAALVATDGAAASPIDTLAFVDRAALTTHLPAGWTLLDDDALLSALDHLGAAEPMALAALKALEAYLARKAACWGDAEARRLSVEFTVCFSAELTPRLDVHHRIRASKLSEAELATLSQPPYAQYVDQRVLRRFQGTSPAAPPASHASDTPRSLPRPETPSLPHATLPPPALPAPPPPAAPPTASAHAMLFSKA